MFLAEAQHGCDLLNLQGSVANIFYLAARKCCTTGSNESMVEIFPLFGFEKPIHLVGKDQDDVTLA